MRCPSGFTLVEALVSLAIVGVGLLATVKTSTQAYRGLERASLIELASVSADNAVSEVILAAPFGLGNTKESFSCDQLGRSFTCHRTVAVAPNPFFRRIDVRVLDPNGRVVVERVAVVLVLS